SPGVVASDLVANSDNKSAVFTGHVAGSATIHAAITGLTSDSGTITVVGPSITSVTGPLNGSYRALQNLNFTVNYNANVTVNTAPIVDGVTGPSDGTYIIGQSLDFTANLSENVTVTGTPRISLTIGATTPNASYSSGSGTNKLVFRYTIVSGDSDVDGITWTS